LNARRNGVRGARTRDGARTPVDHRVPDTARLLVSRIVRHDEVDIAALTEIVQGACSDRHGVFLRKSDYDTLDP
jgi:hypothetical protein